MTAEEQTKGEINSTYTVTVKYDFSVECMVHFHGLFLHRERPWKSFQLVHLKKKTNLQIRHNCIGNESYAEHKNTYAVKIGRHLTIG